MSSRHPAANSLVERLQRKLKAAIMRHADEPWTEALLGIRTTYKEDLQLSSAGLVYVPCFIRPDHPAIRLHTVVPPPHGPTAANPNSTPFIPCHVHQQGPQGFDLCISTAGRHTPCLGPNIQHPAQINHSRLSCAAGRSPCQQTV